MKTILSVLVLSFPLAARAASLDPADFAFNCTASSQYEDGRIVANNPRAGYDRLDGSFDDGASPIPHLLAVYDIKQLGQSLVFKFYSGEGPNTETTSPLPTAGAPLHMKFIFKNTDHELTCTPKSAK